jgi:uncharacterized protein
MKRLAILIIVYVILASAISAQRSAQTVRWAGLVHNVHTVASKALGEERTVLVTLPSTYETSDAKYPVVYMLDAHQPQNVMMSGILEQQAWGGKIPSTILVGIQNTNRVRDLTPTATERQTSGGGPKFLQFIETEVIPLIDKTYRTQPYRVFAGHSLGGLFVVYAFVERPDLFNAYIAASPVLGWDNGYVIKRAENIFKQDREWKKRLYAGIGDEPEYIDGFNSFQSLLKRAKPKDFDFTFQQFKDDNHGSVVLPAYYAGLRKIFEGWTPKQIGTLDEVESHYRQLSDRLGFTVLPSVNLMISIGSELWNAERKDEAIRVFRRNTEIHPTLPQTFDSLAVVYEKTGRLKQARENYEKAYKAAEQRNDPESAQAAKANLERLAARTQ